MGKHLRECGEDPKSWETEAETEAEAEAWQLQKFGARFGRV